MFLQLILWNKNCGTRTQKHTKTDFTLEAATISFICTLCRFFFPRSFSSLWLHLLLCTSSELVLHYELCICTVGFFGFCFSCEGKKADQYESVYSTGICEPEMNAETFHTHTHLIIPLKCSYYAQWALAFFSTLLLKNFSCSSGWSKSRPDCLFTVKYVCTCHQFRGLRFKSGGSEELYQEWLNSFQWPLLTVLKPLYGKITATCHHFWHFRILQPCWNCWPDNQTRAALIIMFDSNREIQQVVFFLMCFHLWYLNIEMWS